MQKIRIGIVGCGAIGTSLCRIIRRRFKRKFTIVALHDLKPEAARRLKMRVPGSRICALTELIRSSDLVIEAASAGCSFEVSRTALAMKKDVLIMSIGGILGKEEALFRLARKNKKNIYLPSGAVAGLDGIRALTGAGIDRVTLRTLKPPAALRGAPYIVRKKIDLDGLKGSRVIFRGSAMQAVKAFPQNINVVALLTLAAKGQAVPSVEIVAVPGLKKNIHIIEAHSKAARLEIKCENVPSPDNPKTSFLAILSAAEILQNVADVVRIGS